MLDVEQYGSTVAAPPSTRLVDVHGALTTWLAHINWLIVQLREIVKSEASPDDENVASQGSTQLAP
eukprot:3197320-Rhodomonas_salina.2